MLHTGRLDEAGERCTVSAVSKGVHHSAKILMNTFLHKLDVNVCCISVCNLDISYRLRLITKKK